MNNTCLCSDRLAVESKDSQDLDPGSTPAGRCIDLIKFTYLFAQGVGFLLGADNAYRRTLGPTVDRLVRGFEVKCG